MFDGKIDIWAFAKEHSTARNSKNQLAGTMEWHQVSANKNKVHEMLIDNVLPAIDRKWPVGWRRKTVLCQQDNASPHLSLDNAEFVNSRKRKRLSIYLVNQPAQSPDLNISDLGLFRLINCLRKKIVAKNLAELINTVHVAYDNLPVCTINNAYVTLMAQMNKILRLCATFFAWKDGVQEYHKILLCLSSG